MQQLLTIDDLARPGWQELIPHAQWLGDLYENFKKVDTSYREVTISMGGDETRAHGIHASEISQCLRKVVYSLLGTQMENDAENVDTNMRRRFQIGHAVHALAQSDFDRMCWSTDGRLTFVPEARVHPSMGGVAAQYEIHSHTDGIFTFFTPDFQPYLRVGLEVKTKSAPEFEKMKKPDDDHIKQAHVYMKALDLPLMWFFYYNKSNSNFTNPKAPYLMSFDQKVWAQLEHRMGQAHAYRAHNMLPDREEGMPCSWCSFSRACKPTFLQLHKGAKRRTAPRPGEFRR